MLHNFLFYYLFQTQKGKKKDVFYSLCDTYLNAVTEIEQSQVMERYLTKIPDEGCFSVYCTKFKNGE